MKRFLSIISAVSIALYVTLSANLGLVAFATEDETLSQEEFINIADEYIEVSDEGVIEFDIPETISEKISEEDLITYKESIDNLNLLIEEGVLTITENGTIYETDNDELVVQGGNVDDVSIHWWGVRRYASHNTANKIAYKAGNFSAWSGYATFASALGVLLVPDGRVKAALSICTACAAFPWAYFAHLQNNINYYNGSRGVVIDVTWVLIFDVYSQ